MSTRPAGRPIWTFTSSREEFGDPDLPVLTVTSESGVGIRDLEMGRAVSEDLSGYRVVQPGDLVVNKLWARFGAYGVSPHQGVISPAYWVLKINEQDVRPRYLHHLLRSEAYRGEIGRISKNLPPNGFDLPWEQFRTLVIPLPLLAEQARIASFLDDQASRIDQIIKARQRQIGLLNDLHLRLIHESTSGEGGTVANWGTWKVPIAFETGSGTTPASDKAQYFDGAIPWVNSGDLNDSRVDQTSKTVTEDALRDYSALKVYPAGSLMVAMYGATVGKTGVLGVDACVNQAVCVLRERGPVTTAYAHYWFLGQRANIVLLASGGGQPNISQEVIRAQRIAAPPIQEQFEIVNELDAATIRRNEITTALKASIGLLEEFKRSLISAAVSGEFDVSAASGRGVSA